MDPKFRPCTQAVLWLSASQPPSQQVHAMKSLTESLWRSCRGSMLHRLTAVKNETGSIAGCEHVSRTTYRATLPTAQRSCNAPSGPGTFSASSCRREDVQPWRRATHYRPAALFASTGDRPSSARAEWQPDLTIDALRFGIGTPRVASDAGAEQFSVYAQEMPRRSRRAELRLRPVPRATASLWSPRSRAFNASNGRTMRHARLEFMDAYEGKSIRNFELVAAYQGVQSLLHTSSTKRERRCRWWPAATFSNQTIAARIPFGLSSAAHVNRTHFSSPSRGLKWSANNKAAGRMGRGDQSAREILTCDETSDCLGTACRKTAERVVSGEVGGVVDVSGRTLSSQLSCKRSPGPSAGVIPREPGPAQASSARALRARGTHPQIAHI